MCDRFGCLPSQARDEDAEVLRLMKIEAIWKEGEQYGGE